tara:strand:- start:5865 stop:6971 length:1107 start_codon:yes stop_codon:yes gene_type:complete
VKILLLVTGGRGGADFFQGLLDGHSEILQFPGDLYQSHENILKILSLRDPYTISNEFINTFPHFFNSKLNKIERHYRLGPKRNKFYKLSKSKFKNFFVDICNKKKFLTNLDILKNLHIAYELAKGKKIKRKKIILVHTHIVDFTKKFIKFININDITIIHTIRNPLSAINSPVKNWLKYERGRNFFPKNLYFQLDLAFQGINELSQLKKKIYIIQMEKLHWEHKRVMNDFCKIFKIKYESCMKKSTYFGLQWWGDRISKRWVSGINKNFKINIDNKYFFPRDIEFFEHLAEDIIKFYKYNFIFKKKEKIYFNLLPMKCEQLVWQNTFKHARIKQIISIPFFYLKRVLLINKFIIKNKYFPYSIGEKFK